MVGGKVLQREEVSAPWITIEARQNDRLPAAQQSVYTGLLEYQIPKARKQQYFVVEPGKQKEFSLRHHLGQQALDLYHPVLGFSAPTTGKHLRQVKRTSFCTDLLLVSYIKSLSS